jgi:hypothetical protein
LSGESDLWTEAAKAAVGCAVNLAIPGLGSLAAAGIGSLSASKGENLEGDIAGELNIAIAITRGKQDVPLLALGRRRKGRSQRKEIESALEGAIGVDDMVKLGEQRGEDNVPAGEEKPRSDPAYAQGLAAIAQAQLAAAASPGGIPGTWQDEFARLLGVIATAGLDNPKKRAAWCALMARGDAKLRPSQAAVVEWSRVVTKVFAARIEANPSLTGLARELREHDQLALQYALLWRLDEQRRALQTIAAVVVAVAAFVGVDLADLHLTL